jgi:hypothetical protein
MQETLSSPLTGSRTEKLAFCWNREAKPKAALISTEDLEKLERLEAAEGTAEVHLHILTQAQVLRRKIQRRRKNCSPILLIF